MTTITEKTGIPLGWAAAILFTVAGVIFQGGISYARQTQLQERLKSVQLRAQEQSAFEREQQLKVQRLDITLESMNKKLQSIDRKLDRLENRK